MKPFPEISSHVSKTYIQTVHQMDFILLSVVSFAGVKMLHVRWDFSISHVVSKWIKWTCSAGCQPGNLFLYFKHMIFFQVCSQDFAFSPQSFVWLFCLCLMFGSFFFFLRCYQRFMAVRGNVLKIHFIIIAFFSEEAISFYIIFIRLLHVIFNIQSPISVNEVHDFLFNRTLHNKDNL